MKVNSLKTLYPKTAQPQFGKIYETARNASVINSIFNIIADMQENFRYALY